MKGIVPALMFFISALLPAYSLVDLYNRPEVNMNSSFNELWAGNYGDRMDLRFNDQGHLPEEVTKDLIKRLMSSNDVLREENGPYISREAEIVERLTRIDELMPGLNTEILNLAAEKNRLYIKRAMMENGIEIQDLCDNIRKELYDAEIRAAGFSAEKVRLARELKSVRRFVTVNNHFIRRNILRINSLGGIVAREPVEKEPVVLSLLPVPNDPPPLVHPETLPKYSLAAMEGFELHSCPMHDEELEYTEKMVAETYRGVRFSYPLYAGWCNIGNTAFVFRELDDESRRIVIEIRNSKKARIDSMLKKS